MNAQTKKKAGARAARGSRAKGNGHGRFSLARNLNDLGSSAQGAVRSGRQAVTSAYRVASGLSRSLPRPRDMIPRAPNLQTMVDNSPLLIGVVGIGVGLLLGALLPIGSSGGAWPAQPSGSAGKTRRVRRGASTKPAKRTKSGSARSAGATKAVSETVTGN